MNKPKRKSKEERPLKIFRETAGLTQQELAKATGCPRSAITYYETGQKMPSLDRAVALARSLNVSLKELARAMDIDVTGVPKDE